jgi:hypothetical protein
MSQPDRRAERERTELIAAAIRYVDARAHDAIADLTGGPKKPKVDAFKRLQKAVEAYTKDEAQS